MGSGLTGELICPGSHSHMPMVVTGPWPSWKNNQGIVTTPGWFPA